MLKCKKPAKESLIPEIQDMWRVNPVEVLRKQSIQPVPKGNLKMKVGSILGIRLKGALASDANFLGPVPYLIETADTCCTIWGE